MTGFMLVRSTLSARQQERFLHQFPDAIVGGTGFAGNGHKSVARLTDIGVGHDFTSLDYSIYPDFAASIGFTQRGCRLKCKFCVVPTKEGKNQSVLSIDDIWRGDGHPKHLHLLDNDFFGQDEWRARCDEIITGGFKVCFSQGINIRLFDREQAHVLSMLDYRDTRFNRKRIYTAWDNLKDEARFFRGIDMLTHVGIRPDHVMAYMLIGYRHDETETDILYHIDRMKERGILPYPMVYTAAGRTPNRRLKAIQRWGVRGTYHAVGFEEFYHSPNVSKISVYD